MELKFSSPLVYQIRYHMVLCLKYRKQLWGGSYWNDGGYIGTLGDGTTVEIVKKYIQEQGSEKEKEQYSQLKLFKF